MQETRARGRDGGGRKPLVARLEWELRLADVGGTDIIDAAQKTAKKKNPANPRAAFDPKLAWYHDKPAITDVEQVYLIAFHDLSTTRQLGMGMGPIPVDRVLWYGAEFLGLRGVVLRGFKAVIRKMDNVYLTHERARQPAGKPPTVPRPPVPTETLGGRRKR